MHVRQLLASSWWILHCMVMCSAHSGKALNGAMHGGGLCAFCASNLCKSLTVQCVADTLPTITAARRHSSRVCALVKLAECSSRYSTISAKVVKLRCWCGSQERFEIKSPVYVLEVYPYALHPRPEPSRGGAHTPMHASGNVSLPGGSNL